MGQNKDKADKRTIAEHLSLLFKRQAAATGVVLVFVSLLVFAASIKFSTDRHVRRICAEMHTSARLLVETNFHKSYKPYHKEIVDGLQRNLGIKNLDVLHQLPKDGFGFYSLGHCFVQWISPSEVAFFAPTHWAGDDIYVRGYITPRFFRSDLLLFMLVITLVLVGSYFLGTRFLLRNIQDRVSNPIHEMWEGLKSGKQPANLDVKEIRDLWISLAEYKELLDLRLRMQLAKQYYHEVKSPAYYQYNQLKRLTLVDDPKKHRGIIESTMKRADVLIAEMEKTLSKIARDDYARFPKKVNLEKIFSSKANLEVKGDPFAYGDKTHFQTLIKNLYSNAVEACGDAKKVHSRIETDGDEIILAMSNPVPAGKEIDTDMIFVSGFTGKINGTGMGLSLCRLIVQLAKGSIKATFNKQIQIFEVVVRLPSGKREIHAPEQQASPT